MKLNRTFAALAALAGAFQLSAGPAFAQATRTWISGVGDDVNPCSRTAPCKTFAGAIAKTAAGGEIDCLDPGGFGTVTITKAITFDCTPAGDIGGVLAAGTSGVTINITSGDNHVQLIGLDIDGLGATGQVNSLDGVNVHSAANVLIDRCHIYGFLEPGGPFGNGVEAGAAGAKVVIRDSVIRDNTHGVAVTAAGAVVQVDNTVLDSNVAANLAMTATGGKAFLNHSTLTSSAAISNSVTPAATVISTGTNFIQGVGAPTSTTPLE